MKFLRYIKKYEFTLFARQKACMNLSVYMEIMLMIHCFCYHICNEQKLQPMYIYVMEVALRKHLHTWKYPYLQYHIWPASANERKNTTL